MFNILFLIFGIWNVLIKRWELKFILFFENILWLDKKVNWDLWRVNFYCLWLFLLEGLLEK